MRILFLFSILFIFSCKPNEELLHQKKIQTTAYKEDCTVVLKDINPSNGKTYYWYKSNEIHQSKGDYSGNLLQGNYVKHYITNQLAEKGRFSYGLKVGEWKSWFKNGSLKSVSKWNKGELKGSYVLYNEAGKPILKGKYLNGNKAGKWVNYENKDTIRYKKGAVYVKKQKKKKDSSITKKPSFFKRIFKKKTNSKREKEINKANKASATGEVKKVPFFKRIFRKKTKPNEEKAANKKRKAAPKEKIKKESFFKRIFKKKAPK